MKKRLIYWFGMMRCGNHAVMEWLFAQIKGNISRQNNCKLGAKINFIPKNIKSDNMFITYEDKILNFSKSFCKNADVLGKRKVYNVIVIRDPFNLFASRFVKRLKRQRQSLPPVKLWKHYAYEYLGITNYIPNKILINYNLWFSNIKYRKRLSKKFGVKFTDKGKDKVPRHGHGSSFDFRNYDGRGSEMDVLNRWRNLIGNEKYASIFDDEVIELSEKIFGKIPGTEKIQGDSGEI